MILLVVYKLRFDSLIGSSTHKKNTTGEKHTMIATYKHKSRLITAIAFAATILSFISAEEWASIIPPEYIIWIPTIIAVISYTATQLSEETRVSVAEQILIEKQNTILGQPLTNEEYLEEPKDDGT